MNVASLELCKELYELSGWDDTGFYWFKIPQEDDFKLDWDTPYVKSTIGSTAYPAYDLGFLLSKLPDEIEDDDGWEFYLCLMKYTTTYSIGYSFDDMESPIGLAFGFTPENAACTLAIKLFEKGILTKGE